MIQAKTEVPDTTPTYTEVINWAERKEAEIQKNLDVDFQFNVDEIDLYMLRHVREHMAGMRQIWWENERQVKTQEHGVDLTWVAKAWNRIFSKKGVVDA